MYVNFIKDQQGRTRKVETGGSVTEDALAVWSGLKKAGYPVEINTDLEKVGPDANGTVAFESRNDEPVARVAGSFEKAEAATQATPTPTAAEAATSVPEVSVMTAAAETMEGARAGEVHEVTTAEGTEIVVRRTKKGFNWSIKGAPTTPESSGSVAMDTAPRPAKKAKPKKPPLVDQFAEPRRRQPLSQRQSSANRFAPELSELEMQEKSFAAFSLPTKGFWETMRDREGTFMQRLMDATAKSRMAGRIFSQDKMIALKRVQEAYVQSGGTMEDFFDTYVREELIHGKVGEQFEKLTEDILIPLGKLLESNSITQKALGQYLHARHARSRNAMIAERNLEFPDNGSGMTNAEADHIISTFAENGLLPALKEATVFVDKMTQLTRDNMRKFGLLREDVLDSWEEDTEFNRTYVNLQGFSEDQVQKE
jgi:hypothetical protein